MCGNQPCYQTTALTLVPLDQQQACPSTLCLHLYLPGRHDCLAAVPLPCPHLPPLRLCSGRNVRFPNVPLVGCLAPSAPACCFRTAKPAASCTPAQSSTLSATAAAARRARAAAVGSGCSSSGDVQLRCSASPTAGPVYSIPFLSSPLEPPPPPPQLMHLLSQATRMPLLPPPLFLDLEACGASSGACCGLANSSLMP